MAIEHASQTGPSSRLYQRAIASIKTELTDFDVLLEAPDGAVAPDLLQTAEEVLSRLVELDGTARAVQTNPTYEEFLAYVDITREEIELHYFANAVNAEWGAYFIRDEQGGFIFDTLG